LKLRQGTKFQAKKEGWQKFQAKKWGQVTRIYTRYHKQCHGFIPFAFMISRVLRRRFNCLNKFNKPKT
jgi:hypothetical protein